MTLMLHLETAERRYEIVAGMLPNMENYREARDFLFSRVRAVGEPMPHFVWEEPENYQRFRKHLLESGPQWPRLRRSLVFFVRCFSICFLIPALLLVVCLLPIREVISFLWTSVHTAYWLASVLATLFITLIYSWYRQFPPETVKLYEDSLTSRIPNGQSATWRYRDFAGWAIVERQFEGLRLRLLLLKGRNRVIEWGLSDSVTREQLAQLLRDKQIPESDELKPSWENMV
jgi:hypothetical protein